MSRSYFNWRQDTSSDLQLFAVLSAMLVVFGGFIKSTIIRQVRCTPARRRFNHTAPDVQVQGASPKYVYCGIPSMCWRKNTASLCLRI